MSQVNPRSCAVLVPVATTLEPQTEAGLAELSRRGYNVQFLRGASMIDLIRSQMASQAIIDGHEETMWIDADMSFNPDDVDKLRALGLPFVAAMYSTKGAKRLAGKLLDDQGPVTFGVGGKVVQVKYVGMGFTLIRREVYQAIIDAGMPMVNGSYSGQPIWPFFQPVLVDDGNQRPLYLSEDYSFTFRAQAVGHPPMVDCSIVVGHVGKKVYTIRDLLPDPTDESVQVVQDPVTGKIQHAGGRMKAMSGITREKLLQEQASLEQQIAQRTETIQRAEAVKAKANGDLEAINGAMQMVRHLLRTLEADQLPVNKNDEAVVDPMGSQ